MGSIIKKKVKGKTYFYYVESKRVNGKPKLVNQKYLGSAEKLLEKVYIAETPLQEQVLYSNACEFGAVSLLYDLANRLDITGMIDTLIPKRKQGVTVGTYILTAAINRAVAPTSKSLLQEWYSTTNLPLMTGIKPSVFTPQNFWNNTGISETDIESIENAILSRILQTYDIDTTHLIYDATNFFTYIDTMQNCELAQRAHSKEKRNDLRVVGMSLMVTPDFSIPLLHETYPGNRHDAREFAVMMNKLKSRYQFISGKECDITVIFDRGNNSEDNISLLESEDFPLHYVGGLRKNQVPELFHVSKSDYLPLGGDSLKGQSAYRMEVEAYGRKVTSVIVYNPELEHGQMQGILINRDKTTRKLLELQQKLMKRAGGETVKGKKPTTDSIKQAVDKILKVEYMKEIFKYEVIEKDKNLYLTFGSSEETLERIRLEQLGKTALFTDRSDFTNEEIINAYRSAWHVESAFKQMKDTEHLAVRPMFHWTDEKIRVHIFTCVLAYRLCSLLNKELSDKGITLSVNKMLNEMTSIRKITTFFGNPMGPEKVESFTPGSELAQQIESVYQLKEKYS